MQTTKQIAIIGTGAGGGDYGGLFQKAGFIEKMIADTEKMKPYAPSKTRTTSAAEKPI